MDEDFSMGTPMEIRVSLRGSRTLLQAAAALRCSQSEPLCSL